MTPTKACPIVLRGPATALKVLAFRHPIAGIQLVKGSIEPGERVDAAVVRELLEEAGVVAAAGAVLGSWDAKHEAQIWAFQLCHPQTRYPSSGLTLVLTMVAMSSRSSGIGLTLRR